VGKKIKLRDFNVGTIEVKEGDRFEPLFSERAEYVEKKNSIEKEGGKEK